MSERAAAAELLVPPRVGTPPAPRVPVPDRWALSNGLRVAAVPRPGLPQVAVRLVVPAGAAADPPEFPGTAALAGSLLTEGTELRTAEELNLRLDNLGASLHVQVSHDFAELDLVLLSDTLREGLELLAEVAMRPSFPPHETERVRAETLDALEARLDEPANVADDEAAEALFGKDHPYGRLTSGTPEAVARLPIEALRAFHGAHYRPAGSVLVAAGDFDPTTLRAELDAVFGAWTGEAPRVGYPPVPEAPGAAGAPSLVAWPDAAQGEIRVAGLGMPRSSPDWIPAAVANYILGGSTITGRLGSNLREEKGWTYGVRSGFSPALQPGGWAVETAVDVEVAEAALAEIEAEVRRIVREPVSIEELERAKEALILSLPRAFETPGRIVGRISTVEAFGLPHDYWERFPTETASVTAEDVLRVARRYFDPERLVRVVVGTPGDGAGGHDG